jgi:hypothetical protein
VCAGLDHPDLVADLKQARKETRQAKRELALAKRKNILSAAGLKVCS